MSLMYWGSFYYFKDKVSPLTVAQVNSLNPQSIPSYDRIAIHQYDINARKLSNILIYAGFVTKFAIFRKQKRNDVLKIAVVGYQSMLMSQALAYGMKLVFKRTRPYTYNPDVPMDKKTSLDARFSFFSTHTATFTSLCYTTAFAYQLYYPDSKYKALVWSSAIVLPAVEGYLRVRSGKHYPSDVITGYLVGLGTAYLMHRLHLRK